MKKKQYNREKVIEYAQKWAYLRNPNYYNFDNVGGDCTSFVSQCIYAGSKVMNYDATKGWYYKNGNNKSPSWSGVEFLHKFLVQNQSIGPRGKDVEQNKVEIGDIAQLSFDGNTFSHTLVIVKIKDIKSLSQIYIASHMQDSFNRRISSYEFQKIRFIHIDGIYDW